MSFSSQPQLLQGHQLLNMRQYRKKNFLSHLDKTSQPNNIIEPFQTLTLQTMNTGCSDIKRYGYCPSNPAALDPEKDAPPININTYNANLSNFADTFNKYKNNVQNYVNNPLTGYEGQNVIVSQLTGGAVSNPDATPCTPNPCGYGQTCTPIAGNTDYFCGEWSPGGPSKSQGLGPGPDKSSGSSGLRPGTNTDLCASNPCGVNGECSVSNGSYTCKCNAGWSGVNCETSTVPSFTPMSFDPCASNPCGTYGTCSSVNGAATCTCTNNYTGPYCSMPPSNGDNGSTIGKDGTASTPKSTVIPVLPLSTGKRVGSTEWSGIGDPDGRSGKNAALTLATYRPDNTKLWGQDASVTCPTAPETVTPTKSWETPGSNSSARSWPCMPQDKIPTTFVGADGSTFSETDDSGLWPPGSWFGGCHYKRDDPKIIAALNNLRYSQQSTLPPPFVTGSDIPKWVKPPCSIGLCSQVSDLISAYSGINNRCGGVGIMAHGSWQESGFLNDELCNAASNPSNRIPGQPPGSRPIDASTCQAWDCSTWETDRAMAIKDNNMIIALSGVGGSIPNRYGPDKNVFGTNTGWWRGDGGRDPQGQWNSGCTPFNEYTNKNGAAIPEYIKAGDKCCCFTDGKAPATGSICSPQLGGFSQA